MALEDRDTASLQDEAIYLEAELLATRERYDTIMGILAVRGEIVEPVFEDMLLPYEVTV